MKGDREMMSCNNQGGLFGGWAIYQFTIIMAMVAVVTLNTACEPDEVQWQACADYTGFDSDGDGADDGCDQDDDDDGLYDSGDPCPLDPDNRCQPVPVDGDGDADSDGDCEVDCNDGVDNDLDGYTDCEDDDCARDPSCNTPPVPSNTCTPSVGQCAAWDTWGGERRFSFVDDGEDAAVLLEDGCYLFAAGSCADLIRDYGSVRGWAQEVARRSDVVSCQQVCWGS